MKTVVFWYCDLDLYKNAFGGKSAPCMNTANTMHVPIPCVSAPLAFAGYPYPPVAHDEADAAPEADAYYRYYGYGLGYRHGYY